MTRLGEIVKPSPTPGRSLLHRKCVIHCHLASNPALSNPLQNPLTDSKAPLGTQNSDPNLIPSSESQHRNPSLAAIRTGGDLCLRCQVMHDKGHLEATLH
jgi:hypothetical protein